MKLYSSPPSPFGRKVKLAAALLGLSSQIEVVITSTANAADPIRLKNPLGKIPALELDDGQVIYDSPVILEYLDHLAGGGVIIPASAAPRFKALTQAALADGIMDAALLRVYETRMRAEGKQDAGWLSYQADKIERGLSAFAADLPDGPRSVADIGLASVLGYLDLRFAGTWRETYHGLVAWLDQFAAEVPAFEATRVKA
jgi:glutathione S-transferase